MNFEGLSFCHLIDIYRGVDISFIQISNNIFIQQFSVTLIEIILYILLLYLFYREIIFISHSNRRQSKHSNNLSYYSIFILSIILIVFLFYSLQSINFNKGLAYIVLTLTLLGMTFYSIYHMMRYENATDKYIDMLLPNLPIIKPITPVRNNESFIKKSPNLSEIKFKEREHAVQVEIPEEVYHYVFSYARIDSPKTLIMSTTSRFNLHAQINNQFDSIVNLKRINDIRYLNKFFEAANAKLPTGGLFIDFVETKDLRKKRVLRKYTWGLNYAYYTLDFVVKRIFPKFSLTKKLYFFLTRGNNRVITKAETFGRLYSCGFEVIAERRMAGHLYFIARKTGKPLFPKNPTYGPIIKLNRYGKDGKKIKVYKLRTMHPFSEFLQEYIYNNEGLEKGGKFRKDFRVSSLGKILRTFWLDELPMFINILKGDLKLVGVRPLSEHYFNLYTDELKQMRIKTKPGLIPPFYVDLPETLEEIMESEKKYLEQYFKNPFITDFKYFFIAGYNILFR